MSRVRKAVVSGAVAAGAVAGGLAGHAAVRRRRDRSQPVGDLPPEDLGYIESFDGTGLAARAGGDAAASVLVLAHGFSLDRTTWGLVWPELARDFRVVAFDHRSHGQSDRAARGDLSIRAMGRDVAAVVEAVAPEGRAVVVGHSMGAMAILAAAEQRTELFGSRIVGVGLIGAASAELVRGAIGSVAELLRPRFGTLAAAARRIDRLRRAVLASPGDLSAIVARLTQFGRDASPQLVDLVVELAASARQEVWTQGLVELLEMDLRHAVPRLRVPTLVVVGEHDRVTPPAAALELTGALPDARLVVLEGAGHLPMLECPGQLAAELRVFARAALERDPDQEGAA